MKCLRLCGLCFKFDFKGELLGFSKVECGLIGFPKLDSGCNFGFFSSYNCGEGYIGSRSAAVDSNVFLSYSYSC